MGLKVGRKGKVVLGTYSIANMSVWELGPMTTEEIETTQFGDEFDHYDFGVGRFGTLTVTGQYNPDDTTGQVLIESAWKNKSLLANLKLYINSVSYWTPDVTNDSYSGVLITSYGAIRHDRAGVGEVAFGGRVSGQMVLV